MRAAWTLLLLSSISHAESIARIAHISVPVADLRSDMTLPPPGQSDDKQQTQLLAGEAVEVMNSSGAWIYVHAVEQPEFTTNQMWEGYPGWILASAVARSSASIVSRGPQDPIEFASSLIGTPYYWGGLTSKGIDCSGLTHLAYRMNGQVIPRDSHEQWMKAKAIPPKELKPGDLIFSGKPGNPVKITHVTLYAGDGQIIEAPQTGMTVRKISFTEKYGKRLSKLRNGAVVNDRAIYFGTFR